MVTMVAGADTLVRPVADSPAAIPDLRAVAGEVIRDLIRRDPVLWERVRLDPALRRQFGFDAELDAR